MIFSKHIHRLFSPLILLALFSLLGAQPLYAYWTWSPEAGKFVNEEGTAEGPAEEQFKYALRFLEEGNPEKAIDELQNLAKRYPNAKITADALFQLGVLFEKKSDNYKAFKTYRKIMDTYPQSPRMDEVVARTYAIGNLFLSGQKPRVMGMAIMPAMPKAIEVFKAISESAPFSAYGDRATFNLAMAYKKSHQYEDAIKAFQKLIDDYPTSELLSDARFQMADTSFQMSIRRVDRDLRSLDVAEETAEEFLREYPDSHITPKAQELIRVINDKNAEKNYRIGLYYESDNFVDSAVIYYEDVVKKYPGTVWYQKARERLGRLKDPGKFMKLREEEIQNRLSIVSSKELSIQAQINSLTEEKDKESREIAERERDRLSKERKSLEQELDALSKSKAQSYKTRAKVLKVKGQELAEKWKNLKVKRKYYKKRMTPDLVSAFKRWEESLKAEEYSLSREKADLETLRQAWGIRPALRLPFIGRKGPAALAYREGEFQHLSELVNKFAIEEEILKERRALVLENLENLDRGIMSGSAEDEALTQEIKNAGGALAAKQEEMKQAKAELKKLSQMLKDEEKAGRKASGKASYPFAGVVSPIAKTAVIPIAAAGKSIAWTGSAVTSIGKGEDSKPEKLEEKRTALKERIARLQEDISATQKAMEDQGKEEAETKAVAAAEQMKAAEEKGDTKINQREVRREVRALTREIRSKYQEVEDRKKHKDLLITQLTNEVEEVKKSTSLFERSKSALKPVTGVAGLMKAFVVGLPDQEKESLKEAGRLEGGLSPQQVSKVSSLKEEIEFETIMIDTRRGEIIELEKKMDAKLLWAKQHNIPMQDVQMARPDRILQSNFEKMGRLISPKTREEILVSRLDKFTNELNNTLVEMEAIEKAIETVESKEKAEVPVAQTEKKVEPAQPAAPEVAKPVESGTFRSYQEAETKYEALRKEYDKLLQEHLEKKGDAKLLERWEKRQERIAQERQRLIRERNDVEQSISSAYRSEAATVEKLVNLSQEKIARIDSKMKQMRFKSGDEAKRLGEEKTSLQAMAEKLRSRVRVIRDEEIKVLEPLEANNA